MMLAIHQNIDSCYLLCSIHSYRQPMGLYGHRNMGFDLVDSAGGEGGGGGGRGSGGGEGGGGEGGGEDGYDYVPHIPELFHHPSRLRSATTGDNRLQVPLQVHRQTSPNLSTVRERGPENAVSQRIIN